jgi:hypothetical protein
MSEQSPETPRREESEVEGHFFAQEPQERPFRARSDESAEAEGPDVEGHSFRYGADEPARGESE